MPGYRVKPDLIERENGGEPMHQHGGNQAGVMRRLS
jgi:hypothetical protein